VDALAMLWLARMKRGDFLTLAPPAALLAGTLVVSRFLGSSILVDFLAAAFIGTAAVIFGYLFSEELRRLIVAQANRALGVLGNLTSRAKPISPANTNAQK
jgi:hypothetical protein